MIRRHPGPSPGSGSGVASPATHPVVWPGLARAYLSAYAGSAPAPGISRSSIPAGIDCSSSGARRPPSREQGRSAVASNAFSSKATPIQCNPPVILGRQPTYGQSGEAPTRERELVQDASHVHRWPFLVSLVSDIPDRWNHRATPTQDD